MPLAAWSSEPWITCQLCDQPKAAHLLGKGLPVSHCQTLQTAQYASGDYEISFHCITNLQGMKL